MHRILIFFSAFMIQIWEAYLLKYDAAYSGTEKLLCGRRLLDSNYGFE